jgi:hypothetical protein
LAPGRLWKGSHLPKNFDRQALLVQFGTLGNQLNLDRFEAINYFTVDIEAFNLQKGSVSDIW